MEDQQLKNKQTINMNSAQIVMQKNMNFKDHPIDNMEGISLQDPLEIKRFIKLHMLQINTQ